MPLKRSRGTAEVRHRVVALQTVRPGHARGRLPVRVSLLVAATLMGPLEGHSQVADLPSEIPDTIPEWDHLFPIWGDRAVERGFDIPYPVGIGADFFAQRFDVTITDLQLSLGDNPTVPIDIVTFDEAETRLMMGNARADLWVFPFLNVSVMYGTGGGETGVVLAEPIEYQTRVDFTGTNIGVGVTGAFGFSGYFFTVNWNQTWFNSSILKKSVFANISGIRAGKNFEVAGRPLAIWIGTMYQNFENKTEGQVTGTDLGIEDLENAFEGYEDSAWYQDLGQSQQALVDQLVDQVRSRDPADIRINYTLNKKPTKPRNFIFGSRYEISKSWEARLEAGFIGREQVMIGMVYRFPW